MRGLKILIPFAALALSALVIGTLGFWWFVLLLFISWIISEAK